MTPRGFPADRGALSYRAVEALARHCRAVLAPDVPVHARLAGGPGFFESLDSYTVATRAGMMRLDYGVVAALPGGAEAQCRFDTKAGCIVVELTDDSYRLLEQGYPRALWTVCHEAGHFALHTDQMINMSTMPHQEMQLQRRARAVHPPYLDTEWQADAFAAALLMPAAGLETIRNHQGRLTPGVIQRQFGVSAEAARIRISVFERRREELLAA